MSNQIMPQRIAAASLWPVSGGSSITSPSSASMLTTPFSRVMIHLFGLQITDRPASRCIVKVFHISTGCSISGTFISVFLHLFLKRLIFRPRISNKRLLLAVPFLSDLVDFLVPASRPNAAHRSIGRISEHDFPGPAHWTNPQFKRSLVAPGLKFAFLNVTVACRAFLSFELHDRRPDVGVFVPALGAHTTRVLQAHV